MIEGLEFDVKASEMKVHLYTRVEHHDKKAKWHSDKAEEIGQGFTEDETRHKMSNSISNPKEQFVASARRHRAKASLFRFMAAHVVEGETYRLGESDLNKLEFTESEY